MRPTRFLFLFSLFTLSFVIQIANGQPQTTNLQPGTAIERTLSNRQADEYTIALEQGQFLELVVDQRGIDVIVRVFGPKGRPLGEFDSPNGNEGPENVSVVAVNAGIYRIQVAPLNQFQEPSSGRYEIKITDLRAATDQELKAGQNETLLKANGLALINDAAKSFSELHRAETRAGFEIRAAKILWDSDEKRAAKLIDQAINNVKEFIAKLNNNDADYYASYEMAQQLRQEVINVIAPHDPDLALDFLRATREIPPPPGSRDSYREERERQIELSLTGQIAAKDPKRAFQLAEESLKESLSPSLGYTLSQLRAKSFDLASQLAHDMAARLMNEQLLKNSEAANLASNFLNAAHPGRKSSGAGADNSAPTGLISEDQYRDLIRKILSEVLSYQIPSNNTYSPERNSAQSLTNTLKQMPDDMQSYAPDQVAAFQDKWLALQNLNNPAGAAVITSRKAIENSSTEASIEAISQSPENERDQLYQQLAYRMLQSGEFAKARQIISDHVTESQRTQSLRNVERQEIFAALSRGKVDEMMTLLRDFESINERTSIIAEIAGRVGNGLKRGAAINCLEQLRAMLDPSPRAEDQETMAALLQIARGFSRYDIVRATGIIEPLVDQFNEISMSAVSMNGFGQRYYRDGELILNNGNSIAELSNRLAAALASLAMVNFERAKVAADRIRPLDVRLNVYVTMAQQAVQDTRGGVINY